MLRWHELLRAPVAAAQKSTSVESKFNRFTAALLLGQA